MPQDIEDLAEKISTALIALTSSNARITALLSSLPDAPVKEALGIIAERDAVTAHFTEIAGNFREILGAHTARLAASNEPFNKRKIMSNLSMSTERTAFAAYFFCIDNKTDRFSATSIKEVFLGLGINTPANIHDQLCKSKLFELIDDTKPKQFKLTDRAWNRIEDTISAFRMDLPTVQR